MLEQFGRVARWTGVRSGEAGLKRRGTSWVRALGRVSLCTIACVVGSPSAAAQSWLGRLSGPHARSQLRHPEADLRRAAAERLGFYGAARPSVDALLRALRAGEQDARVRAAILAALARRAAPVSAEPVAALLARSGQPDAEGLMHVLGAVGTPAAAAELARWLGSAEVGDAAVDALVAMGPAALPYVLRALRASDAALPRAARALGRLGDARASVELSSRLARAAPEARVPLLQALGELRDVRTVPAVLRYLEDPSTDVVVAAVDALAAIGDRGAEGRLGPLSQHASVRVRAHALRAWLRLAPERAAARAGALLAREDTPGGLVAAIMEAVYDQPNAHGIGMLSYLCGQPEQRAAAADALARVPRGRGVRALLEGRCGRADRHIRVALARGLRRHRGVLGPGTVGDGIELLRRRKGPFGWVLRALAGDRSVAAQVGARLQAASGEELLALTIASVALPAVGAQPANRRALAARLENPLPDADFRAIAQSMVTLGIAVEPRRALAYLRRAATAPEALALVAPSLGRASERLRTRLRRAMRRGLRDADPRVRAAAALALARAGERAAASSLARALDDSRPAVRLAAARALHVLGGARGRIVARYGLEREPAVRSALGAAMRPTDRPPPVYVRGAACAIRRVEGAAERSRPVDLRLPDGRWLRTSTFSNGYVVLPDVPERGLEVRTSADE